VSLGSRRSLPIVFSQLKNTELRVIQMGFTLDIRTQVVFGEYRFQELATLAQDLGFCRTLLVSDPGLQSTGYPDQAIAMLSAAGIAAYAFHDFSPNPDTEMVEAGRIAAAAHGIDSLVALGGGSSLDCAKGINFVLTNGAACATIGASAKPRGPCCP
jgi:alcohol dehydrogenase